MRIYAHRGVSAHLPENTLSAFCAAIALGVDGIELDVHLSADQIPMVIHDETADRTTNGTGSIREFTARQLGLLDAGGGQFVPTLAQVLKLVTGKLQVNIEIKDPTSVHAVLAVIAGHPGLDWFCSSTQFSVLEQMRVLAPDSDGQPVWEGILDRSSVDLIQARGLKVWAWTVNDTARARVLASLGVDALCTDDPELIRHALTSISPASTLVS